MRKILITLAIFAFCGGAYGQKITALTESTSAGETSLLIVREGATGNLLKRITVANLFTARTLLGTTVLPATTSIGTVSAAEILNLDGVTGSLAYSTENYGATGTGNIVLSTGPTLSDVTITGADIFYTPLSTGTITDATGITAAMLSRIMYYSEAAATDISSDPQIANGTSGQIITIIGSSDTNTLTLDDSTGLRLTGQMILGIGDNITLLYEGTIGDWVEIGRSAN